ncbi:TetR/AcrR family transcriptional regulator [Ornithinimicrobium sufpigmenti]|uniref:TetR/AcrR family transcriptional regulator n=1 Tax=Ornithinimicrobium sufpigmenti TaxID=2508882 RepID=UPI00103616EC|nr:MULTISPECIES: TetR/AcrR family transcriptional regulator [unclassified Ornithinimicrobium]
MTSTPPGRGPWRQHDEDDLPVILRAALDCFVSQGYHGTTTRQIAGRSGLSVPGVYHHHASKQALLAAVMEHAMEDLWWRSQAAAEEAGPTQWEQLAAQVECLVLFHSRRQDLAFISWSEIRSLETEHRVAHIERRDRQQAVVDAIVARGAAEGVFRAGRPKEAARAITTLCVSVAQWYRADGPLSPDELAAEYVDLVQGMLRCGGPAPAPASGEEISSWA